jgi:hypothetical protein
MPRQAALLVLIFSSLIALGVTLKIKRRIAPQNEPASAGRGYSKTKAVSTIVDTAFA